jgi:hypothetical protein
VGGPLKEKVGGVGFGELDLHSWLIVWAFCHCRKGLALGMVLSPGSVRAEVSKHREIQEIKI